MNGNAAIRCVGGDGFFSLPIMNEREGQKKKVSRLVGWVASASRRRRPSCWNKWTQRFDFFLPPSSYFFFVYISFRLFSHSKVTWCVIVARVNKKRRNIQGGRSRARATFIKSAKKDLRREREKTHSFLLVAKEREKERGKDWLLFFYTRPFLIIIRNENKRESPAAFFTIRGRLWLGSFWCGQARDHRDVMGWLPFLQLKDTLPVVVVAVVAALLYGGPPPFPVCAP